MKAVNLCLFGTVINNGNMGCVALTYSTILVFEEIAKRNNIHFNYTFIERTDQSIDRINLLKKQFNFDDDRIKVYQIRGIYRHFSEYKLLKKLVNENDIFFDLTEGDSFSDIYGQKRFYVSALEKLYISKKKPLILGPQTYGPFSKKIVKFFAKKIIKRSYCVISRDELSISYLNNFVKKKIYLGTDLAFGLPYNHNKYNIISNKIKVGLNISGLLYFGGYSGNNQFDLKMNYKEFINTLINFLNDNGYEIFLVPHVISDDENSVDDDYQTALRIKQKFDFINVPIKFKTPIEAKSYISNMDVLIGSRMHATIAAISSKVSTIPLAYSRKFKGLFDNVNYPFVIDCKNETNESALKKLIDILNDLSNVSKHIEDAYMQMQKKYNEMINYISCSIEEILHEK